MKPIDWTLLFFIWLVILALLLSILQPSEAQAVSSRTRAACTGSYLNYCSHTTPGTPQCRACFRFNWKKLDAQCQAAIRTDPSYKHNFSGRRKTS
jgi:hypothetical protein